MKKRQDFFVVVIDHDNKVYTVNGPTSTDTFYVNKVNKLQKEGRSVNCFTSNAANKDGAVQNVLAIHTDYTLTDEI